MESKNQQFLYQVRNTCLEMITDRGYHIPIELTITLEEFRAQYMERNIDVYIHDEEKNKNIYIHFYYNESRSFSKTDLKNLYTRLIETYRDENMTVIILLNGKENSLVSKELMKPMYFNVEIFEQRFMSFNIRRQHHQPPYIRILNSEEESEILTRYSLTKNKMPKIQKTDAIAKYYGAKQDQIIYCIRHSSVSGETPYFRVVK